MEPSASNTWWRTALQHAEPSRRGGVFFNVHPLTQLAWSDPAVPPPPESLRLQAQVRGRFATDPSLHGPSLLPFPGCGVVNSAARTMAISTNWQHVRATAAALESGDESPDHVVDIFESSIRGMWQVAPNDLEYYLVVRHRQGLGGPARACATRRQPPALPNAYHGTEHRIGLFEDVCGVAQGRSELSRSVEPRTVRRLATSARRVLVHVAVLISVVSRQRRRHVLSRPRACYLAKGMALCKQDGHTRR